MRACKGCGARAYRLVRVKKGGVVLKRFRECLYCGNRYPVKVAVATSGVYKEVRVDTLLNVWDRAFGIAEYGSVPHARIGEMMK